MTATITYQHPGSVDRTATITTPAVLDQLLAYYRDRNVRYTVIHHDGTLHTWEPHDR